MTRSGYRHEVERLLEQIADRMREIQVLRAYGARSAALRAKKEEVRRARLELAQLLR